MKSYQFHPDAEAEFLAQRDYYDSCEAGLGARFVSEVLLRVYDILEMPSSFPLRRGFRHCLLRVFPFDIVFEELEDKIVIYAVAHTRRRPGYWKFRLK